MSNWVKLLNRECSLAFQAEVPYVNRNILPGVVGIPINNFWCESVTFGVYYKRSELKGLSEALKSKIVSNPSFSKHNVSDCYKLGDILIESSFIRNPLVLKRNTNIQLLQRLNKFREAYINFLPYLVYPHAIERYFMEIISTALKNHLITLQKENDFDYVYEVLTTPTIHEIEEQINLLFIANKVKKRGWNNKNQQLIEDLKNKYIWQPFWTITAKPLTKDYFKNAIQAYIDIDTNLDDEIKSIKQGQKDRKCKLENVLKQINVPKSLKAYVKLLQEYMYLRTYRKNIISRAHYLHLPLLLEIGNRMGIGQDIKLISYEEMINYLKNNDAVMQEVVKKRKEAWAVLSIDGKISIISGITSVKTTAKEYKIEDLQMQVSQKVVKGRPACLGKVTGKVRIIMNIKEINKIKQGDVLITPMTTPDFVPILKKVYAIVTDEGGVTCHAAIVSREFSIPCIVGTGNATKVFKDGDVIEVDAKLGVAKII